MAHQGGFLNPVSRVSLGVRPMRMADCHMADFGLRSGGRAYAARLKVPWVSSTACSTPCSPEGLLLGIVVLSVSQMKTQGSDRSSSLAKVTHLVRGGGRDGANALWP